MMLKADVPVDRASDRTFPLICAHYHRVDSFYRPQADLTPVNSRDVHHWYRE